MRLSWIIHIGAKFHNKCPYKKETEVHLTTRLGNGNIQKEG